ncbi:hypothetical protein PV10_01282 [Exophiala mesophila]|uniref:GPI inositol-deacylase n=1 Tax=Exophiala mesophila TaxID=212818 RepID=A0A0D2AF74_EXOME|nr:uncharacterized protein PV10_01282 [Exophiala mesophila]KIV97543.1 hypothetical protein PV10_01282 [Exophiala mesophila]
MLLKPKEDLGDDNQSDPDVRGLRKIRAQNPWTWRPLTLLTTAVALLLLFVIVRSSLTLQVDPQGCVMSMMTPTYIKLSGFDTEHSRFATKYSLYLYREEGVDEYSKDNIGLRGAPVLFIPGNAGSYKQVRSLSSEASRYYHGVLKHDSNKAKDGLRQLDFFTLDFNEDLSAFHGQTLFDQAEYVNEAVAYILSLYTDPNRSRRDAQLPDPSSVILIGHSMGGIVARTVLVTPKFQANSVNTIITMSTPHARPPVTFDADIVSLYQSINAYWRESYLQRWASNNPLWHTTLISIAGGGRDTTVPSDYTNIASLVPESHGFTVFSSGIPTIWTAMDHLAITWADQMRKVIIKALFEVVDVRRAAQTKPRAERMKVFRKYFLTGLEEGSPKNMRDSAHEVLLTLGDGSRSSVAKESSVTIRQLGSQNQMSAVLLPIPTVDNSTLKRFSLLTDQQMDPMGSLEKLEVLFCSAFPLAGGLTSTPLSVQFDLSPGDPSATRLACKRPVGDNIQLPASTRSSQYSFEQRPPFTFLSYDLRDLQEHQFVAIIDKSTKINGGWLHSEIASGADSIIDSHVSLPRLLLRGLNVELPATRPIMTELRIPSLRSSLLAYKLQIRQHGCNADSELFTPLVRQFIDSPHESKFFVNFKEGEVNLHGVAPFMPPALYGPGSQRGIAFQIWSDPTCKSSLEVRLRIDPIGSLGKVVIRYRTVFAAFPLLVVAMVLRKQFRVHDNSGVFISFSESLDQSLRLPLPILLLSMTFFATAFTSASSSNVMQHHQHGNGTTINFAQNDLLLGSQDTFFWFLVPLAGLLSIGACVVLNYIVLALLHFLVLVSNLVSRQYIKLDDGEKVMTSAFVASTPRRRAINTAVLLFLVATIIPYPFAYVVACMVQLMTCTRALRHAKDSKSGPAHNFFNYTYSILHLMLWVLPINLPVLVVWIHNMAVHWLTPFSSHHNVLSIAPFIFLVEILSSGMMVPLVRSFRWATNLLFFVLAVYSALYGMTYAYRLHYIANIIALWLVLLHFSSYQKRVGA